MNGGSSHVPSGALVQTISESAARDLVAGGANVRAGDTFTINTATGEVVGLNGQFTSRTGIGSAGSLVVLELLGHEHLDTLQHYAKLTIADLKKRMRSATPANARVETLPPLRTLPAMTEIIFEVREDEVDGGYTASALGVGVHSQGDTLAELRANVKEAVDCYFDETMEAPKVIRLHFVRDEVLAR
jgi:predicted RNase H-like HicB family nuclease